MKKELCASLFKAYSLEGDRDSGAATDNFERMFMLIINCCDQVYIREADQRIAFSIILCEAA